MSTIVALVYVALVLVLGVALIFLGGELAPLGVIFIGVTVWQFIKPHEAVKR